MILKILNFVKNLLKHGLIFIYNEIFSSLWAYIVRNYNIECLALCWLVQINIKFM